MKGKENVGWAYAIVRSLLRLILFIFFRDVNVVNKEEHVPRKGAVIFVGNHSNQFVVRYFNNSI
jgi:1-acyl-sn-glycerol-3-phosphate acyltransferase